MQSLRTQTYMNNFGSLSGNDSGADTTTSGGSEANTSL